VTKDHIARVIKMFLNGSSVTAIHYHLKTPRAKIQIILTNHFKSFTTHLGHKNEAYFTENEMLNSPVYRFEDLNENEREL